MDVEIVLGLSEAIICVFMQLMLFIKSIRFELEILWFKLNFEVTCYI
jgi:hypothetical protein